MEIKTIGRFAYVVKGVVKEMPYADYNTLSEDMRKLMNSQKPFVWMYLIPDDQGENILEHSKFNKRAIWQKVLPSCWPRFVQDNVAKQAQNPDYLGCRLLYWAEAEVYKLEYEWKTDTGMKLTQHVLLGKESGGVRWFEYD